MNIMDYYITVRKISSFDLKSPKQMGSDVNDVFSNLYL